jgi:hypothetical protein
MCSRAVIAIVHYTPCQQNDLPFAWCEGALLEQGAQREIPFQDERFIRKDGHQIGDEAE